MREWGPNMTSYMAGFETRNWIFLFGHNKSPLDENPFMWLASRKSDNLFVKWRTKKPFLKKEISP